MSYQEFFVTATGSKINAGDNKTNATSNASGTYLQGGGAGGADLFTCTGNPFAASVAGDYVSIYTNAATTTTFIGRILVVNSANSIDISLTSVAGTRPTNLSTWTATVGGAWLKPTGATTFGLVPLAAFSAATNAAGDMPRINFQSVTGGGIDSAMTATTTNAVAGPYVLSGYKTTPGDGQANPSNVDYKYRIDGSTNNITIYSVTGANVRVEDFVCSNNATGSGDGLSVTGLRSIISRCVAFGIRRSGIVTGGNSQVQECEAYNCNISNTASQGGFVIAAGGVVIRCISHDNTSGSNGNGFMVSGSCTVIGCMADTNSAAGYMSAPAANQTIKLVQSDAYNNGTDGFRSSATGANGWFQFENCNFEANGTGGTGYGINRTDSQANLGTVVNCSFFGNATGQTNGLTNFWDIAGSITNTSTAYNAPSTGDFRIVNASNKNTGRGSFCETQASYTGTVAFPDVGVAQHLDSGGGGSGGGNILRSSIIQSSGILA